MAVISDNTFDPLKGYTGVRLQQGVPIADADWNAQVDTHKFELRSFLRWFVGDGVPWGNDGFRIAATTAPASQDNNFRILSGIGPATPDALNMAGRCLAGGLEAIIVDDIDFTAQPLHEDQPGAAALAAKLGVPVVARMPTPNDDHLVNVFVDVWEHLVTPADDPELVLPALGTETCARIRRAWVVRIMRSDEVGAPLPGHGYLDLASIRRRNGVARVEPGDVIDRRRTGMTVMLLLERLRAIEELLVTPSFVPSPNQFSPKFGIRSQEVTLRGRSFDLGDVQVRFGTTPAAVVKASSTEIQTTVPEAAPDGTVKIHVKTDGGEAVSDDDFTVLPGGAPVFDPPPNEFDPPGGRPGQIVTLHGRRFDGANLQVRFDVEAVGILPGAVMLQEPTRIGVRVPPLPGPTFPPPPPRAAQIIVTTDDGTARTVRSFRILPLA
jgi:IPT/TIG domain/Family of unknown function (DUF6519)